MNTTPNEEEIFVALKQIPKKKKAPMPNGMSALFYRLLDYHQKRSDHCSTTILLEWSTPETDEPYKYCSHS